MSAEESAAQGQGKSHSMVTAKVAINIGGSRVEAQIDVPAGPTRSMDMLPIFHQVCDTVVKIGVQNALDEGRQVSCCAGCGACCRQMVPISELEARQLRELVDAMPEPRRTTIRARFSAAVKRLHESGMLDKLMHPDRFAPKELENVGLDYYYLGIPCPFLEQESCSIYPDRPLICREYLVTTPAENCRHPSAETIDTVTMPARVGAAVRYIDKMTSEGAFSFVPLTLAILWTDGKPQEPALRPGPDILREFFDRLTGETNSVPACPTMVDLTRRPAPPSGNGSAVKD